MKESKTCSYYLLQDDKWHNAPDLNVARSDNSSCSLGNYIYTFCGQDENYCNLRSIERLYAKNLLASNYQVNWALFEPKYDILTPRSGICVAVIDHRNIMLIGGGAKLSDIYLFDTRTV